MYLLNFVLNSVYILINLIELNIIFFDLSEPNKRGHYEKELKSKEKKKVVDNLKIYIPATNKGDKKGPFNLQPRKTKSSPA